MEGILKFPVSVTALQAGMDVITLTTDAGIFSSRGEVRKLIQNGGLSINRKKVTDATMVINESQLLHNKYVLVQKGKSNYYLLVAG